MHQNDTPVAGSGQLPSKPIVWTCRTNLTSNARHVAAMLDTAPSMYGECWRGAEWIAEQVGLCVRTVRQCIRELELKGLVRVERDYSLISRRRIILLWRAPSPVAPDAEGSTDE